MIRFGYAPFHGAENTTGKMIVFGHTPVYNLFKLNFALVKFGLAQMGKWGLTAELFTASSPWNCTG
jgi:hypothetical protein